MIDLVNISLPTAGGYALLGYGVVFFGLVLLMCVLLVMGKIMTRKKAVPTAVATATGAVAMEAARRDGPKAKGTAGDLKLYDTDPRDAAVIMAIVADATGKPLNELRFLSIHEIKEEKEK